MRMDRYDCQIAGTQFLDYTQSLIFIRAYVDKAHVCLISYNQIENRLDIPKFGDGLVFRNRNAVSEHVQQRTTYGRIRAQD